MKGAHVCSAIERCCFNSGTSTSSKSGDPGSLSSNAAGIGERPVERGGLVVTSAEESLTYMYLERNY